MVAASSVRIKHCAQFTHEEVKEEVNRISVDPLNLEQEIQSTSILKYCMLACQIISVNCRLF